MRNIIAGQFGVLIESMFRLSAGKCDATDARTRTCQQCEKQTWLSKTEYAVFVFKHGREFIKNLDDLTRLPELPKGENDRGKQLFCRLCKCYIPAKVRVQDEVCPLGKW